MKYKVEMTIKGGLVQEVFLIDQETNEPVDFELEINDQDLGEDE